MIPDVVDNARRLDTNDNEMGPLPAITRIEVESPIKLLTIADNDEPLRTYRGFLAISERVRREQADFFLQPHKTEIVWGGQKVLYIFQHHSGAFALYYELQGSEIVAEVSAGSSFPTCTIVIKNQIYIPVPNELRMKFLPAEGSKKRFAVRSDLLFPE